MTNVLVINCGSSSLKYQLLAMEDERLLAKGLVERIGQDEGHHLYKRPELEDVDFDDIIEQIKSGAQGKIIEVEDVEDGERVEIYVE